MEDVKVIEEFLKPRNTCYGSGYGSGSGDGSGDGSGYGSGSGDGSGYGYGYGSGSGDGIKEINGERVWMIDDVPTIIDHVRGDYAQVKILQKDLTTESCYIARVENCFAHGNTLKEALADAESKAMEGLPVSERIARFRAAFPSLDTVAKCSEFYRWHHTLTGSCRMGRDQFMKEHGLDMEKDYTVRYFLDITKDAYGCGAIRKLIEAYEE